MDEFFRVDDLLNFPNEDHIFSSMADHTDYNNHHLQQHYHHPQAAEQFSSPSKHIDHQIKKHYTSSSNHNNSNPLRYTNNSSFSSVRNGAPNLSYDFTDQLCVPNDDVAELEWLSNFVDDSFTDFNTTDLKRTLISQSHTSSISIPNAARSKRSRQRTWKASASPISSPTASHSTKVNQNNNSPIEDSTTSSSGGVRRCTHCASEKTPQWRTGPMGPKTLCNACGVRYKSGRLVPEYRPAASPTFVLTQHSNSHRKVMELRRQKEVTIKHHQGGHASHAYRHHHTHDFQVC